MFKIWTVKKTSFVAILIATSVVFVLLFSSFIPFSSLPTFKIMAAGLPIKLSGYIFGPVIGLVTGALTDLISFMFFPTYFHYWYLIAFALVGLIPGIFGMIMNRSWRNRADVEREFASKKNATNLFITLFAILINVAVVLMFTFLIDESEFTSSLTKTRGWFLFWSLFGSATSIIAITFFWFFMRPRTFNRLIPLIAFSIIVELVNTPLTALGDIEVLSIGSDGFINTLVLHLTLSPIKIWGNMLFISIAYRIVAPLIYNKTDNGWETTKQKKNAKHIYVCGPTVYDKAHIGNLRPITVFDIAVKSMKYLDPSIKLHHNITDIDDKIIKAAIKEGVSEKAIAAKYSTHYKELIRDMNITTIDSMPTVTDELNGIIEFIDALIAKGTAYEKDGNVWYRVSSDKSYGSISGQKLSAMKDSDSDFKSEKENSSDFALWKRTTEGVTFKSPWGRGRPGWHTECAEIIDKTTNGQQLIVHGGGIDLKFPHHENEATQYRATNGREIAKKWVHVGSLNFNGEKMSKSIGNVITGREFIDEHGADTLRMAFLNSSYKSHLNITPAVIKQNKEQVNKIRKAIINARLNIKTKNYDKEIIRKIAFAFSSFDFSEGMKLYNELLKKYNSGKFNKHSTMIRATSLLGLNVGNIKLSIDDATMYKSWERARNARRFEEADQIRDKLMQKGLI